LLCQQIIGVVLAAGVFTSPYAGADDAQVDGRSAMLAHIVSQIAVLREHPEMDRAHAKDSLAIAVARASTPFSIDATPSLELSQMTELVNILNLDLIDIIRSWRNGHLDLELNLLQTVTEVDEDHAMAWLGYARRFRQYSPVQAPKFLEILYLLKLILPAGSVDKFLAATRSEIDVLFGDKHIGPRWKLPAVAFAISSGIQTQEMMEFAFAELRAILDFQEREYFQQHGQSRSKNLMLLLSAFERGSSLSVMNHLHLNRILTSLVWRLDGADAILAGKLQSFNNQRGGFKSSCARLLSLVM
jgi:hypothetical protein